MRWALAVGVKVRGIWGQSVGGPSQSRWQKAKHNVLKPVPQPPLEPELDFEEASGTKFFWGDHAMF